MLSLGPTNGIFVALDPVDMRGSFNGLADHVRRLHREPLVGHVYLFVNHRRRLLRALWFDRTGWALYSNAHPLRRYRQGLRVQPKLAAQGMPFVGQLYDLEDEARDEGLTGARPRTIR